MVRDQSFAESPNQPSSLQQHTYEHKQKSPSMVSMPWALHCLVSSLFCETTTCAERVECTSLLLRDTLDMGVSGLGSVTAPATPAALAQTHSQPDKCRIWRWRLSSRDPFFCYTG